MNIKLLSANVIKYINFTTQLATENHFNKKVKEKRGIYFFYEEIVQI